MLPAQIRLFCRTVSDVLKLVADGASRAQSAITVCQSAPATVAYAAAASVSAAVVAALAAQDVTVPAEAATGRVISELAAELGRVCGRRDALAGQIEEAFLGRPFGELLASMPGIGPRTGARILAEIGDGSAFRTGSKLAYAGLAPVTRHSGTSLAGESRSRRGNHRPKNAMFLAAFASLRDPAAKAFYDRNEPKANATTPP